MQEIWIIGSASSIVLYNLWCIAEYCIMLKEVIAIRKNVCQWEAYVVKNNVSSEQNRFARLPIIAHPASKLSKESWPLQPAFAMCSFWQRQESIYIIHLPSFLDCPKSPPVSFGAVNRAPLIIRSVCRKLFGTVSLCAIEIRPGNRCDSPDTSDGFHQGVSNSSVIKKLLKKTFKDLENLFKLFSQPIHQNLAVAKVGDISEFLQH